MRPKPEGECVMRSSERATGRIAAGLWIVVLALAGAAYSGDPFRSNQDSDENRPIVRASPPSPQAGGLDRNSKERPGDQTTKAVGIIKGRILNRETQAPLDEVSVSIAGTEVKVQSNSAGAYSLSEIPVGFYVLNFQKEGYYADTRTDVLVRPGRITFLNMELLEVRVISEEIRVSAVPFPVSPAKTGSLMEFNPEELRRDAASAGDLSRALYAVPGIVKADEEANDLIVRGGSPSENGFYIDNIFIPNINHFPQQGASGGNICMLNMDFFESLRIYTGGFDASYGNRLSSILDISYREGNRDRFNGQFNLSAIGYGAQFEGPLPGGKGAWMLSGNRSYLDLISGFLGSSNPADYYDIQGKVTYDLGDRDKLSLLALGGSSWTSYDPEGREKYNTATAGLSWRHLWGGAGYSDTSVSLSSLNGTENNFYVWEGRLHEEYDYGTRWLNFRNVNHLTLSASHQFTFGIEAQKIDFRNWDDFDYIERRLHGGSGAAFLTYQVYPLRNFSLSAGLRLDSMPFSKRSHLSPRLSFIWNLSDRLSVNGAYGLFFQQMPLFLIQQDPANVDLKDSRARHFVLGFKYLLSRDTQLTLEAYDKQYRDFPMSTTYPYFFVIDNVNGDEDRFGKFGRLVDEGKAYARGVELTIQKKLSKNLYGLINLTYYRTRYRDLMGFDRNRLFDNRFILCLSGGYKPNKHWELSGRWVWSGNKAFTPVDEAQSIALHWPIMNLEDVMSGHLHDYQNLSLRIDRRFYFKKTNLVVFVGAMNVFDHQNELYRNWDYLGNRYDSTYMWGRIPYLGLEFEF